MNTQDHEGRAGCLTRGSSEGRDVERAADRRRGNPLREMHQVADESPRPRQRKISSFRFVHPCTSRGTSRDHSPGDDPGRIAWPGAIGPGRVNRTGEPKPTRNRSSGEGEAGENETGDTSSARPRRSRLTRAVSPRSTRQTRDGFPRSGRVCHNRRRGHTKGIQRVITPTTAGMAPTDRARVFVHLLPSLIPPGSLRGGVAVVVDVLRATTVMVYALAAGCEAVIPCGEIDEAKATAASLPPGSALLAGERQGLPIPGFDLGNSPGEFTPEVCRRQDARHDHDQRHPGDPGQPGGRAGLHRQLRQPAGNLR